MKYLILFLAQFALLVFMIYVAQGLDGWPEFAARAVVAVCTLTGALTVWRATHSREARKK